MDVLWALLCRENHSVASRTRAAPSWWWSQPGFASLVPILWIRKLRPNWVPYLKCQGCRGLQSFSNYQWTPVQFVCFPLFPVCCGPIATVKISSHSNDPIIRMPTMSACHQFLKCAPNARTTWWQQGAAVRPTLSTGHTQAASQSCLMEFPKLVFILPRLVGHLCYLLDVILKYLYPVSPHTH
jgi:hypothetical protein